MKNKVHQSDELRQVAMSVDKTLKFIVQEPSMAKNSSPSRAPKNWRSTPDDLEEREKCVRAAEKPVPTAIMSACGGVVVWSWCVVWCGVFGVFGVCLVCGVRGATR